ncbi:MAG: hypothetical protein V3S08_05435 [Phycisphaerales bacterium]
MTERHQSRLGLWDKSYEGNPSEQMYGDPTTAKIAGAFLNQPDIERIEDWGCGFGGFKAYIGDRQTYVGVDGSKSRAATVIADLETYTSDVDAIHMRGVLAHNPNWQSILRNSIASFNKRMVLTLFTPFQETTSVIDRMPDFNNTGTEMIDIGFARQDIVEHLSGLTWFSLENIKTDTKYHVEHVFFVEK